MSRPLRLLTRARADIDAFYSRLIQRSTPGAAKWYETLFATLQKIADNPENYPILAEALPRWN